MKLLEIKKIESKIVLETGLHIGAGNDDVKIGGIDNPVIKNPITNRPYIPGSSIKGKVRTLLEWEAGQIGDDGKPSSSKSLAKEKEKSDENVSDNLILRIFGNGEQDDNYKGGPTRVSFEDCNLDEEQAVDLIERKALTEDKIEVVINRKTGTAAGSGPRHMERVPAGAGFDFSLTFKIFDMGNEDDGETDRHAFELLKEGLKMLEQDALGGSSSRGYGKFRFEGGLKESTIWTEKKNN